jgi:quinol monooxygenase YgiN
VIVVLFRARISLSPATRTQVVQSLRRILGQTRALPGCINCQLCVDFEDENHIIWSEEWPDVQTLRSRLRADSFAVILSALESACEEPEVRFDTVSNSRGMAFIAECRGCEETEPRSTSPST